jgi:glucosamine-6-phosphate deaminase
VNVRIFSSAQQATDAAGEWLATELLAAETKNIMVAGGNTPLALYAQVAQRNLPLQQLRVFALDEYVGVPKDEPRNCANLIRSSVVEAWKLFPEQYWSISSSADEAEESIAQHEATLRAAGGLDLMILGLGRNGHIGFNEPGSTRESVGRVVPLSDTSIEANRQWFAGAYAPSRGATTGMKTILAARCVLLLAFGPLKSDAVVQMIEGPQTPACPASFLQTHPKALVFLDADAASRLSQAGAPWSDSS